MGNPSAGTYRIKKESFMMDAAQSKMPVSISWKTRIDTIVKVRMILVNDDLDLHRALTEASL